MDRRRAPPPTTSIPSTTTPSDPSRVPTSTSVSAPAAAATSAAATFSSSANARIKQRISHSTRQPGQVDLNHRFKQDKPTNSQQEMQHDEEIPMADHLDGEGEPRDAFVPSLPRAGSRNKWIVLAIASGVCAAFNGVFAKLTTGELTSSISRSVSRFLHLSAAEGIIEVIVRVIFFGLNLVFNGVMWTLFTQALAKGHSTTQVSIMNTSSNFVLTAVMGFAIFSESLPPLWWLGAALLVAGNVIIGQKDESGKDGGSSADKHGDGTDDNDVAVAARDGFRDDDDVPGGRGSLDNASSAAGGAYRDVDVDGDIDGDAVSVDRLLARQLEKKDGHEEEDVPHLGDLEDERVR